MESLAVARCRVVTKGYASQDSHGATLTLPPSTTLPSYVGEERASVVVDGVEAQALGPCPDP